MQIDDAGRKEFKSNINHAFELRQRMTKFNNLSLNRSKSLIRRVNRQKIFSEVKRDILFQQAHNNISSRVWFESNSAMSNSMVVQDLKGTH